MKKSSEIRSRVHVFSLRVRVRTRERKIVLVADLHKKVQLGSISLPTLGFFRLSPCSLRARYTTLLLPRHTIFLWIRLPPFWIWSLRSPPTLELTAPGVSPKFPGFESRSCSIPSCCYRSRSSVNAQLYLLTALVLSAGYPGPGHWQFVVNSLAW